MRVYSLTKLVEKKREEKKGGVSSRFIGIDIGAEQCCVSVIENGRPVIIPNSEGERITPAYILFTKDGQRLIGTAAKRQMITKPKRVLRSGIKDMGAEKTYSIDGTEYKPQDLYQMFLEKLKKDAETYLGEKVQNAVIAVPSSFTDVQRRAVMRAAGLAGLPKIRIINESSAAAMTYGFFVKEDHNIMIYNLGAGCFDISINKIEDDIVEVISINGDSHLGGNDFDDRIVQWMLEEYKKSEGIDLAYDVFALQRLREAAENAKKTLSITETATISLNCITSTIEGPKNLTMTLSREKFEQLIRPLLNKMQTILEEMMWTSKVEGHELKYVFLTGGSTHIPAVQQMIKDVTNLKVRKSSNPEESVAMGAAIMGAKLSGEKGRTAELMLLEVLSQSLCIETQGGVATRLIDRNTTIPTRKSQIFSTAVDNQKAVDVNILQGEEKLAKDNKSIGTLRLDGILPAKKGVPQLEVIYDIDPNGILTVSAKDLATGKEVNTTVSI